MEYETVTYILGAHNIDEIQLHTGWNRGILDRMLSNAHDRGEACVIRVQKEVVDSREG